MLLVIAAAGALWVLGIVFDVPRVSRWAVIGVLLAAVLAVQLILPQGHPLREATGGSYRPWLVLGGLFVLVAGYRMLLARLHARAAVIPGSEVPPDPGIEGNAPDGSRANAQGDAGGEDAVPAAQAPAAATGTRAGAAEPAASASATGPASAPAGGSFSSEELRRYARHIMLREIGGPGQKALRDARVLVVGAGGLGAPALLYLAAAGVGRIGIVDDDTVELSNLQRQIIHRTAAVGAPKVSSAADTIAALNPHVVTVRHQLRLDAQSGRALIEDYDLVLDGSDNFDTRYLVNRLAAQAGIPLIAAAITQWEGQISLYDPAHGAPCYECIFPTRPAPGMVPSCAEAGVAAPLPGVLGSMMALEAVKWITGAGQSLAGRMLIFDGLWGDTRSFRLSRREDCPVCARLGRGEVARDVS